MQEAIQLRERGLTVKSIALDHLKVSEREAYRLLRDAKDTGVPAAVQAWTLPVGLNDNDPGAKMKMLIRTYEADWTRRQAAIAWAIEQVRPDLPTPLLFEFVRRYEDVQIGKHRLPLLVTRALDFALQIEPWLDKTRQARYRSQLERLSTAAMRLVFREEFAWIRDMEQRLRAAYGWSKRTNRAAGVATGNGGPL